MEGQIKAVEKLYNHFSGNRGEMLRSLRSLVRSVAPDLDHRKVYNMVHIKSFLDGSNNSFDVVKSLEGYEFNFSPREVSPESSSFEDYKRVVGVITNCEPIYENVDDVFSLDFYERMDRRDSFFSMEFNIDSKKSRYKYSTQEYDFTIFKGSDEDLIKRSEEIKGLKNVEYQVRYLSREIDELFYEFRERYLSTEVLGYEKYSTEWKVFNDPFFLSHAVSLDGEDYLVNNR